MQIINLYKYHRADGGTTVSPNKPDCEYSLLYRLVADEGKVLTDGETMTSCTDTAEGDKWQEVDAPEEEATEEDYLDALAELGVTDEESNA